MMTRGTMTRGMMNSARKGGFTLVEVIIAFAIFVLISINVGMVTNAGRAAATTGTFMMTLEDELHLTVDRISLALMAADSSAVDGPAMKPLSSENVSFQTNLGLEDGQVVHGPLEEIEWLPIADEDGRVVWRERPNELGQRQMVWSNSVPQVYQGEVASNGIDDNQNDIEDESGLAFTMDGARVDIHVTVERTDDKGVRRPMSRTTQITCRN